MNSTNRFRSLCALALVTALVTVLAPTRATAAEHPNILILYADDLGYGDLSIQNPASKIPTPNFDKLAREGLSFTDGHSSSGICTPSRYALLTGRHHWRDFHGIVNAFGKSVFKKERLTLPELLQSKGYTTACIGKWHLGWDWDAIKKPGAKPKNSQKTARGRRRRSFGPEAFDWTKKIPDGPLAHGFDHYFGDTVINFPPYCWIEDDKVLRAPDTMMSTKKWKKIKEGNWECRPGPMISDWNPYDCIPTLTKRGVDYIRKQKDSKRPFFLFFAYPSPHAPIIPNDRFDGKSKAGPYGDFVYETDDSAGQLLAALDETGQAKNTIVVFTADNGPEHYAYARDRKFDHWSAKPFRGLKRDIYEGGHHVPFIVKWPGVTKPGTSTDALASQIDLMATFADLVGAELPADAAEDSHNLMPILRGTSDRVRSTHIHNTFQSAWAIRHDDKEGNWLLVVAKHGYHSRRDAGWEKKRGYSADDKAPVELYDLKTDIGQKKNVASDYPKRVEMMSEMLERIRKAGHSAPRLRLEAGS